MTCEVPSGWSIWPPVFSQPFDACYGNMTLKEFADEFCVSLSTVRRWVRNGDVNAVQLPGAPLRPRRVIPDEEVEDFKRRNTNRPAPKRERLRKTESQRKWF